MQSYIEQLIYFGFLQSFFLLIVFGVSLKTWQKNNGYIFILICFLFLGFLGRVLYSSEYFGQDNRLLIISELSSPLFCSTLFLFTRSLLYNREIQKHDLIHYIPAVLYDMALVILFIFPNEALRQAYSKPKFLFYIISILLSISVILNFGYWFLSWVAFQKFKRSLQDELSYTVKTQFFQIFLLVIGGCITYWFGILMTTILNQELLPRYIYDTIWLSLTFMILIIGYYCIREPLLFKLQTTAIPLKRKYQQSKLKVSDLDVLKLKLEQLMIDKKPYLNCKLLKTELAEMMEVSDPELARLLNESIGMNFFEYINYFRVKEFIKLAQSDKNKQFTFFAIAQEAGFNSRATFNSAFKRVTRKTPREYLGV